MTVKASIFALKVIQCDDKFKFNSLVFDRRGESPTFHDVKFETFNPDKPFNRLLTKFISCIILVNTLQEG